MEFLIKNNHHDHATKCGPDRQVGVVRTQPHTETSRSNFFVRGEPREGPLVYAWKEALSLTTCT